MTCRAAPLLAALLALAGPAEAPAAESYAVLAVADPPAGPDADLAELAHQLRAALRERAGGVLDATALRTRLQPPEPGATLPELERAFQGAMATLQSDDPVAARQALRTIAEELERAPEGAEAYRQWTRALAWVAYLERYLKNPAATAAALEALAATEPTLVLPERDFPPSFRREFDEVRRRVSARPAVKLTLTASGPPVTGYVNGRDVGRTPLSLQLPAGRYRVGAADGALRIPPLRVQLESDDRALVLDTALAAAVRPHGGPGLAVSGAGRAPALVRAGARLGASRVVAAAVVRDADASFLEGTLLDVPAGATLRAGRVRMAGGSVPAAQLGALAAFLLTGQPVRDVQDVSPPPPVAAAPGRNEPDLAPSPAGDPGPLGGPGPAPGAEIRASAGQGAKAGWLRPTAYASAAVAVGLAGVATWQGLAAHDAYGQADAMLLPGGVFVAGADKPTYDAKVASADTAKRNAWIAVGGAAVFAVTAGVLGYLSWDDHGAPVVRF
ncbi:MAG TPA: hypothetical protein VFP65_23695 [Anaeromyxobacteraceae bacterium]|nr:hypothetical protein [Anaeromyxobacteraceae bacterium]